MTNIKCFVLVTVLITACESSIKTSFHYDDLSLFRKTVNSLDTGSDSMALFNKYLKTSSPGLKGWSNRYRVSPELFMQRYPRHKEIYDDLPNLETFLMEREWQIEQSIEKLIEITGLDLEIPVYYFVSNQHLMAGTPILADSIIAVGVAVGIEPDSDTLNDLNKTADLLLQLAIHEAVHIFQIEGQGGSNNYRSIYDPSRGNMMGIALREGCAEYITYLVSGFRFGDRHLFVEQNEKELWNAFKEIAYEPPFSVAGWFGGKSEEHPEWPFQVGYSLGFNMCEAYHLAADNPDKRKKELVTLYNQEDIQKVWKAYENSF